MNPAQALQPAQRPIAWRDFALLLAGLAIVLAPHALRAPWWLTVLTALLVGWRAAALAHRSLLPSTWLLLAFAAFGMLGIWLEYRAIFGRTPGIMLLVLFSGLKMLESRNQRDAAALVFLTWFLAITNFLYTQSIPTALGMCAAVATSVAALVGFAAPRRALRANLRTAGLLLGQAVPAALVLFLLFPRVQGPLWGLPQDAYSAMSGLSDSMSPGSLSQLTLSDAIAFRVDFEGELPPRRTLYWRGPVLWDFDGRTWRLGSPTLAELPAPRNGSRIAYSVLLEPHNRNWLFALEAPASLPPRARYLDDGQIVTPAPIRSRLRYDMVSLLEADPEADEERHYLERALRLPPGFNPRARAGGAMAPVERERPAGARARGGAFPQGAAAVHHRAAPARPRLGGRVPVRVARRLLRAFFLRLRVPVACSRRAGARGDRLPGRRPEPGGCEVHRAPVRRARLVGGVHPRPRLAPRRPDRALGAAPA